MKQTARFVSTYAADISGVCSALYELGGMSVMHDASGCNSTYHTHDEPRWYDQDSLVFISGLSEMDAVFGGDEKLMHDIVAAANQLSPRFIAIGGTPIPMMIGTDFHAVASIIEAETGIPTFGLPTNGMHTYISGAAMAFAALADRFCTQEFTKTEQLSINLLGITPLDFTDIAHVRAIRAALEQQGIAIHSCWAMGDALETLQTASQAHCNLVVSACGLKTAQLLEQRFGIPYVIGRPIGTAWTAQLAKEIRTAVQTGENRVPHLTIPQEASETMLIGEGVMMESLAAGLWLDLHQPATVIAATEYPKEWLRADDIAARDEAEISQAFTCAKRVIADPLYRPICPQTAEFMPLGHVGFSGRIYQNSIPHLLNDLTYFA